MEECHNNKYFTKFRSGTAKSQLRPKLYFVWIYFTTGDQVLIIFLPDANTRLWTEDCR